MSATSTEPHVVAFDAAGAGEQDRLGGKGASLAKMVRLGMPVPPGFILSTEVGRGFLRDGALPESVLADVENELESLERQLDRQLGNPDAPLLVSVRSGAPVSMPGMMDTILNVGLNDDVVDGLARHTRDPGFAWGCWTRSPRPCGASRRASSKRRCWTRRRRAWPTTKRAANGQRLCSR
jgi:pyruvate, orthophosphate dikinase